MTNHPPNDEQDHPATRAELQNFISAIQTSIADVVSRIDLRLHAIEQRVEHEVTARDGRLAKMESRLTEEHVLTESRAESLAGKLDSVLSTITSWTSMQQTQAQQTQQLHQLILDIQRRDEERRGQISNIRTDVIRMTERMKNVESRGEDTRNLLIGGGEDDRQSVLTVIGEGNRAVERTMTVQAAAIQQQGEAMSRGFASTSSAISRLENSLISVTDATQHNRETIQVIQSELAREKEVWEERKKRLMDTLFRLVGSRMIQILVGLGASYGVVQVVATLLGENTP